MTAMPEEGPHILECIGLGHHLTQGLGRFERSTVPGKGIGDLPLGDGHQRKDMDPVLQSKQDMNAAPQDLRLVSRFPVQGDYLVVQ